MARTSPDDKEETEAPITTTSGSRADKTASSGAASSAPPAVTTTPTAPAPVDSAPASGRRDVIVRGPVLNAKVGMVISVDEVTYQAYKAYLRPIG